MSRPLPLIRTLAAALLALIVSAASAQAQTNLFWQAPNGGDGTWNFSNTNWATTAAGLLLVIVLQMLTVALGLTLLVLFNRNNLSFLPLRDYRYFVGEVRKLYERAG